jgi:hypothetical protein
MVAISQSRMAPGLNGQERGFTIVRRTLSLAVAHSDKCLPAVRVVRRFWRPPIVYIVAHETDRLSIERARQEAQLAPD